MSDEIKSVRMTTVEAAKMIGCSRHTIPYLIKKGKLEGAFMGGSKNRSGVTRASVEKLLKTMNFDK